MYNRAMHVGVLRGLCVVALVACGSSSSSGDGGGSSGDVPPGGGTVDGGGGSDTPPGGSSSGSVPPAVTTPVSYPFRYGINMGHRNGAWGDDKEATLAAQAGARSIRVKLPASHLKTWGYDIEVGDNTTYASLGMKDHIGFLIGSETVDQSIAPAGSEAWKNEYFIPKNLYEPIFAADGTVNANNYWATYIYKTVAAYKTWIKVWHIWNEPDWVGDWHVVDTWKTAAPKAADLPRFNGSIFDYVRMLRIAKVVATKADPDALIATGGIGYAPFLDAILRYTDNPVDGSVTTEHPATGASYVDVVDFHYYPIFSPKSSDASVDDFIKSKNDLAAVLTARGRTIRGWNVSETGAPSATTPAYPTIGSPEYARNYLLKVMTSAQANGIGGVDWFILSEGEAASTDAFAHMGLYADIGSLSTVEQAVKTDVGRAYTTLTKVLEGARYDAPATTALALPATVGGAAFLKDGKRRLALWAKTPASAEVASASLDVTTSAGFDVYAWDGAQSSANAAAGKVSLALTGSPVLLVEH